MRSRTLLSLGREARRIVRDAILDKPGSDGFALNAAPLLYSRFGVLATRRQNWAQD